MAVGIQFSISMVFECYGTNKNITEEFLCVIFGDNILMNK